MSVRMSREEFYDKYGSVQVAFISYYKFTFTYAATLPDGKQLTVSYGGNSDQIYRHEVSPDRVETVRELQPYSGAVYDGPDYENEVEWFYDY
jgi:hypothetical protein